jgi:hypothetical protein
MAGGAIADEIPVKLINRGDQMTSNSETGIEVGALIFLGSDFRFFHRPVNSPWLFGFRILDIEDDFINEAVAGLTSDNTDREFTKRSGPYMNYLFDTVYDGAFYAGGALYRITQKIKCNSGSDSDSETGLYFGGGYRKRSPSGFGYDIGLQLSPFVKLETDTTDCSSSSKGDIDLNASLFFSF